MPQGAVSVSRSGQMLTESKRLKTHRDFRNSHTTLHENRMFYAGMDLAGGHVARGNGELCPELAERCGRIRHQRGFIQPISGDRRFLHDRHRTFRLRHLPQITFTMGSANREAVAYLFAGDTDADGVPDAYVAVLGTRPQINNQFRNSVRVRRLARSPWPGGFPGTISQAP